MTLSQILAEVSKLSMDEKVALNRALVENIRAEHRVQRVVEGRKFLPGQIVEFYKPGRGRNAGWLVTPAPRAVKSSRTPSSGPWLPRAPRWLAKTTMSPFSRSSPWAIAR